MMLPPIEIDPKTFLRQHSTLPALPAVVGDLQSSILDDDVDIAKIADLVSSDPSLLAEVLKVVNSAYYGLSRKIANVLMAVAILGFNEIYRIVVCLAVVNSLSITQKKEVDEFWFHSFFAATCARYLAKRCEPLLSREEIWLGAMLHDIGKLVYLKFYPDHYRELRAFSKEQGCLFSQAESDLSLPSSAYFGTVLCDRWKLPDQARRGCEFHTLEDLLSTDEDSPPSAFRRMICLGNLIAVLFRSELNNVTREQIADVVKTELNCSDEDFLALMGDIYHLQAEVEDFVGQFT